MSVDSYNMLAFTLLDLVRRQEWFACLIREEMLPCMTALRSLESFLTKIAIYLIPSLSHFFLAFKLNFNKYKY